MWVRIGKILVGSVALASAILSAPAAQAFGSEGLLCDRQGARLERRFKIPDQLLRAVSLAESGRWDGQKGEKIAWPWTVTAEGQGNFFPNRLSAIAAVRRLQANGVKNIDVGCMQINLYYHADAFQNLEQAFDPASNITYAATFLTKLFKETHSWSTAISYYHSRDKERGNAYREKVVRLWNEARFAAKTAQRERQVAAVGGSLYKPKGAILMPRSGVMPASVTAASPALNPLLKQGTSPSRSPWQDWRRTVSGTKGRVLPRQPRKQSAGRANSKLGRSSGKATTFATKRRDQLAAWRKTGVWR